MLRGTGDGGSCRANVGQQEGHRMLVLTRKSNQSIMIGDDVEVSVLSVMGEKVRIGIQAPQEIPVFRKEIYLEIHREDAGPEPGTHAEAPDAAVESTRAVSDGPDSG
jgi:carbon storage regulator